jgi:hypothetical protein
MVYSTKGNGYITEKGYKKLKSAFAKDIFRNEQYKLFKLQTDIREELKDKYDELLRKVSSDKSGAFITAACFDLALHLSEQPGKKQYGYLPKDLKAKVDFIVKSLAEYQPEIKELYSEWNRLNREKLSVYYDSSKDSDIPLEENKEFQVIKNKVIHYCLQFDLYQGTNSPKSAAQNNIALANEIAFMVAFIINTANQRRLDTLHSYLDDKEREKLLRKKQAHGQKDGVTQDAKKEKDESEAQRAADNATVIFDLGAAAINAAYESAKAKYEQQERLRQEAELQKQNYPDDNYDDEDEDEGFTMTM